jgi:hypothetical protein
MSKPGRFNKKEKDIISFVSLSAQRLVLQTSRVISLPNLDKKNWSAKRKVKISSCRKKRKRTGPWGIVKSRKKERREKRSFCAS